LPLLAGICLQPLRQPILNQNRLPTEICQQLPAMWTGLGLRSI